jgi:hypothetical protein
MKKLIFLTLMVTVLISITGCIGRKETLQYKDVKIYCKDTTWDIRYSFDKWTVISAQFGKLTILPEEGDFGLLSPPQASDSLYCIRVITSDALYLFPINPGTMKILNIAHFLTVNKNTHTSPTELRNMKNFYHLNARDAQYILDAVSECPEIIENNIAIVWGLRE